jgi:rfaE bifunctional protein nucleotidyltransferase chain/domain
VEARPVAYDCSRHAAEPGGVLAHLRDSLPRPLVFTNGVFDLLHAGHVVCLEQARQHGGSLVVGINSDASARRLGKGRDRPLNRAADRARVVGALAAVSAVVVFEEDKPLALICALRPEVYVKGGDYSADKLAEAALMAEWGGRTVIVPRHGGLSTSHIIQRARGAAPGLQLAALSGVVCARANG